VTNQAQRRVTPAKARRDTKKLNRRKALARRAAARRRRQYAIAGAAAAAVLLIVGAVLVFGGHKAAKPKGGATRSGGASSAASAGASASLPPGTDPALATKPVVAAPSGTVTQLKVTTLVAGTGPATQNGQTLEVNYVGVSYKDGQEFDSSWKTSQPYSFKLGQGQVIKGWDQGLLGVKVGSRVQLDIPADLGYGDGDKPTNGSLRFVVDVLSAK